MEVLPSNAARCPNCGAPRAGRFCQACGQDNRRLELSARDWLTDASAVALDYEAPLLRTLRALTRNPGRMVRGYVEGQRARYVRPFRYALLMSALWWLSKRLSTRAIEAEGVQWVVKYGQLVNLALLPLVAVCLWAGFLGARTRYGAHLVFLCFLFGHAALWRTALPWIGREWPASVPYINTADSLLFLAYLVWGLAFFHAGRVRFLWPRIVATLLMISVVSALANAVLLKLAGLS